MVCSGRVGFNPAPTIGQAEQTFQFVSSAAMDKVQEIVEKQVLTVAKVVEDKLDEEISALDRLDLDDIEVLRERRLHQMKKMVEKQSRWISLGHGEYSDIPTEKDFFSVVKASERASAISTVIIGLAR